jgi:methylthioribose-1-phosphate isomerase
MGGSAARVRRSVISCNFLLRSRENPQQTHNKQTCNMVLQAIKYSRGQLEILDQLKLPHAEEYDHIYSSTDAWHAIKEMRTRGAPAIAIVAALSLAVELSNMKLSSVAEEVQIFITEKLDYLVTSRPTAVNLADAAGKLRSITEQAAAKEGATGESLREAYVQAAEQMLIDDVSDNENIGKHGAEWIVKNSEAGKNGPVSMLTHCNTGYAASPMPYIASADLTDRWPLLDTELLLA